MPIRNNTHEALAYIQAQRFFVEHYLKESKQMPELDQFQTTKWLAMAPFCGFEFLNICVYSERKTALF